METKGPKLSASGCERRAQGRSETPRAVPNTPTPILGQLAFFGGGCGGDAGAAPLARAQREWHLQSDPGPAPLPAGYIAPRRDGGRIRDPTRPRQRVTPRAVAGADAAVGMFGPSLRSGAGQPARLPTAHRRRNRRCRSVIAGRTAPLLGVVLRSVSGGSEPSRGPSAAGRRRAAVLARPQLRSRALQGLHAGDPRGQQRDTLCIRHARRAARHAQE
jgi:hypothetical protein